jgi:UDP-N-acetylmuramoyl-tripeptide--D-alanyl-D-alanine ligase
MEPTHLERIARWAGGELLAGDAAATVETICTDSRALRAGDLFLALRGENFDGHSFVREAAKRGALGAVVEDAPEDLPPHFAIIRVGDTLRALQEIAASYRRNLPLQAVCITGSNGKTSTKDLTASVLGEHFPVTKTEGNLNNHIGLPLSILRARASDEIGVFEIGMNHPGEIAPLARIAAPDVAIITNIGTAHIEFLGTREAIAQEKGMLAEAVGPSGTVILNAGDAFSAAIAERTKADTIFCGLDRGDIHASDLQTTATGIHFRLHGFGRSVEAALPVPGIHMVHNALLAVGAGHVFGLSLEECAAGLAKARLTRGRLEQKLVRGIQVIDDTYNANPDSMKASLLTLAQMSTNGRRIAVLGRMGELGTEAEHGHREVGRAAVDLGLDCVITVGEEADWIAEEAWRGGLAKVLKFPTSEEAVRALREIARAGDLVLVKGSRSARMERIIEGLHRL